MRDDARIGRDDAGYTPKAEWDGGQGGGGGMPPGGAGGGGK